MAGEIQLNSTTMATESSGTITLSNVNSATNRTNLGLGSMATQNANAVALTGGSLTGTEIDLKSSGTTIYKSDGTTAVLSESGGVVTLNNASLSTNIVFPTRSDFGIVELIDAGGPIIGENSTQDYSYTSGEKYFVFVDSNVGNEYYEISTSNVVTESLQATLTITPSIPTAGTLRITTGSTRELFLVILIRMSF